MNLLFWKSLYLAYLKLSPSSNLKLGLPAFFTIQHVSRSHDEDNLKS